MAYRIAQKPILRIVGIRIPMTEDMEENLGIVPEFWKAALLQIPLPLRVCVNTKSLRLHGIFENNGRFKEDVQSVFKRFFKWDFKIIRNVQ